MCGYRDSQTGLPSPSYDLWEERKGVLSFTVGTVFGGLTAASLFCNLFGEDDRAAAYQKVAAEIRDAASRHFWREDLQRFCRMIYRDAQDNWIVDSACDSSLWGLFAFGLYRADDPRIMATMAGLRENLWIRTSVGGMARYEKVPYQRVSEELLEIHGLSALCGLPTTTWKEPSAMRISLRPTIWSLGSPRRPYPRVLLRSS